MRVLVIMTALADASVAMIDAGVMEAERRMQGARGLAEILPDAVIDIVGDRPPALIAVLIGPGSFTGIRAGLALAHGLAMGWSVPVVGVTVGEVLACDAPETSLMVVTDAQRDRFFVEEPGSSPRSASLADLVPPPAGTLLAGDGAARVQEHFALLGVEVSASPVVLPSAVATAAAATARHGSEVASGTRGRPVLPLYVDPPKVSVAAAPPRPSPARPGP